MKKIFLVLTFFLALLLSKQSHAQCTATISANGPTTFCDGSVTLQASAGTSYQWTNYGSNISGATASSYVAKESGNYACVVTNTCGSATSNAILVAAMFTPASPGSINGLTSGICPNTNTMYAIGGLTGGYSYIWKVPTGVTIVSGQGTTNLTVRFPTSFAGGSISVSATNNCGTGPASSLSVSTAGLSSAGRIQGATTVCTTQSYTYSVAPVDGATKYTWTVPSRAKILSGQGTTAIQVKFAKSSGNITVAASNACMSSATSVLPVTVNCSTARLAGELDNETIALGARVYPNPSSESFHIEIASGDDAPCTLIVRDITGRELERRENIFPGEALVFGSRLVYGIYLAEVQQGEERVVLRVVKGQ